MTAWRHAIHSWLHGKQLNKLKNIQDLIVLHKRFFRRSSLLRCEMYTVHRCIFVQFQYPQNVFTPESVFFLLLKFPSSALQNEWEICTEIRSDLSCKVVFRKEVGSPLSISNCFHDLSRAKQTRKMLPPDLNANGQPSPKLLSIFENTYGGRLAEYTRVNELSGVLTASNVFFLLLYSTFEITLYDKN